MSNRRERKERAGAQAHQIKIGDIFAHRWGYDQTNVDAYEVTAVSPMSVVIRQITTTEISDGPRTMTGKVKPNSGDWDGPAMRRRIKTYDGQPALKINDYTAHATPWDSHRPKSVSHYA